MQVAFNGLLRWALQLLLPTRVDYLHMLGNLPPPTVLIAKQLVHYVASLQAPPATQLGSPPLPLPGSPLHTTRIWDAILAAELPLEDPLLVAPIYWQQFVLQRGAAPSIADLYTEAGTLLWTGLEAAAAAHGAIGQAGTLALWLDILPHLFTASTTHHTLPGPWVTT